MNLKKIALIVFIIPWHASFATEKNEAGYQFYARTIDAKSGYFEFTYINTSDFAQCILAADFEMNLLGDSLIVKDSRMNPVSYIGPMGSISAYSSKKFIILAPGMKTLSSIYLNKFYKIKKVKEIYISYRIPVIPCASLLDEYIKIPPAEFIKGTNANFPMEEKTMLERNYPDWAKQGFIATMEPLSIPR